LSFNPPFTTCWYDSLISRATKCALVSVVGETSIDQVYFERRLVSQFTHRRANRRSAKPSFGTMPRHRFAALDRL
jgi:hypothetical protein